MNAQKTPDPGLSNFRIADDASFVNVFVSEADVGDACHFRVRSGTMLIACAADFTPLMRRVIFIGQPTLRARFDLEPVGLRALLVGFRLVAFQQLL